MSALSKDWRETVGRRRRSRTGRGEA